MIDEPPEQPEKQVTEYDGTDPEAPIVIEPHKSGPEKHDPNKYANWAAHYAHITCQRGLAFTCWLWKWAKLAMSSANFWIAIATIAIAVSTGIYTHYARKQWQVMSQQLKQMTQQLPELQKAAKAAQDSADLSRQQVIASQAAILNLRFDVLYRFLPGEHHGLRAMLEYRSGTAMVTEAHESISASWVDSGTLRDIGEPQHVEIDIRPFRAGDPTSVEMIPLKGLNPTTWDAIRVRSSPKTIQVKGTFRYHNGFAQVPDQQFCYIYFAHPEVNGNSLNDFVECGNRYHDLVVMFAGFDRKAQEEQGKKGTKKPN